MKDLRFPEILKRNRELESSLAGERYEVAVLSNTTTALFNDVFAYSLRSQGINARVTSGDYDNILQNSARCAASDLIVVFMEAANLVDGLQYTVETMDDSAVDAVVAKARREIDFVLASFRNSPVVLFNRFSSLAFSHGDIDTPFDRIARALNAHLEGAARSNVRLIDIDKVIAQVSVDRSVDFRYYYSSKALYTLAFFKAYSAFIDPIIRAVRGATKKALIFDCDNTLWKGVLGEDGADHIEMSAGTAAGVVFREVQHLAVALAKRGVLVGLCSKNNPGEVDEVIRAHPDMVLRNEFIAIKKVNWEDKVSNLTAIATELNIGLDSIVFVDDSDLDASFVQAQLSDVTVVRVPLNLYEYPAVVRECSRLFYRISGTADDEARIERYRQESRRQTEKSAFASIDDFLASLELKVDIHVDQRHLAPRISQLTQRTNQFNLTTRRYTEQEIETLMASDENSVLAFEASDRFGRYGLVGVSIIRADARHRKAFVDSLLMSCRAIGRNLELKFLDFIVDYAKGRGMVALEGEYIQTAKNVQVADFYDKAGFRKTIENPPSRTYMASLDAYVPHPIDYIEVRYGGDD
jgi:FkbH-like protein